MTKTKPFAPFRAPYLIQRLGEPMKRANPFSFGGGYRNGGLSKEGMDMLLPIFSFDYMGAAEFEFGALPDALNRMIQSRFDFIAGSLPLEYKGSGTRKVSGAKEVYYFCHPTHEAPLQDFLEILASDIPHVRLKEGSNFSEALFPMEINGRVFESRTLGWLDLDNSIFFSKDKEMFDKFVELMHSPDEEDSEEEGKESE